MVGQAVQLGSPKIGTGAEPAEDNIEVSTPVLVAGSQCCRSVKGPPLPTLRVCAHHHHTSLWLACWTPAVGSSGQRGELSSASDAE